MNSSLSQSIQNDEHRMRDRLIAIPVVLFGIVLVLSTVMIVNFPHAI